MQGHIEVVNRAGGQAGGFQGGWGGDRTVTGKARTGEKSLGEISVVLVWKCLNSWHDFTPLTS